jgi:predicted transposase YdaD
VLKLLADNLSSDTREQIMTIAGQLRQEGRQSGKVDFLTHLLTQKFGDLPQTYMQRIQKADVKKAFITAKHFL